MINFKVEKSYENADSVGALGRFQMISLHQNGIDVTDKINVEQWFDDEDDYDELKTYISKIFEINKDEIYLDVVEIFGNEG
jgi:hypothetical protein